MKRVLYFLFIGLINFSVASDSNNKILKEAQYLESIGNFKEAMFLYKKIALQNQTQNELSNTLENLDSTDLDIFTETKKSFFQENIDKTNDKETNSSIEQLITKDFGIYPYKKNYILPATYTSNNFKDRKHFETSFQISLEKPIFYNILGLDETISLAYTQKSFWQTASSSAPFRETNYEPEIFMKIPHQEGEYYKLSKISFLHSSNGKSEDDSRSLNRVYLQGFFQFDNLFVSPRVWYRIPESESKDDNKYFYKYYGYGDLNLLYAYKKHTFELLLRNNLRPSSSNKGAVEFNWSFPLPAFIASKNTYGLFQVFHGYGHSLIDYDKELTNIGFGITFSR